jgi:LuxR family transcriptional regulator, maltose regulon positive regulatory protein
LPGGDRLLGRGLARRLAKKVVIHDLGRIQIEVGTDRHDGADVRRKVLALLTFLTTRLQFSATREEVMDALWPDQDPSAAINSLNQSVYFLRRVFEPEYSEDTTAGYVQQDSELLWLDPDLIRADSSRCGALIGALDKSLDAKLAHELSQLYRGRFALDFMYDEWSEDFRDWLHVGYLRVIEAQIESYTRTGESDAGLGLARNALLADPRNHGLESSLLRLLRAAGAHSAAAEQQGRYESLLRADLGIEPESSGTGKDR